MTGGLTEIELAQMQLNAAAINWRAFPDSLANRADLIFAVDNFRAAAAVVVKRAAMHNPNEVR